MVDAATKKALSGIPLMKTKAGPRDKEVLIINFGGDHNLTIKLNSNFVRCGPPD